MRSSQKLALTILIALVFTAVFALLAYTGLFRLIEVNFYSKRIEQDQGLRLEHISDRVAAWNRSNLSRFESLALDRTFQSVYSLIQRDSDIQSRIATIDALNDNLSGFSRLRIVDEKGKIQYSSFAGDISSEQTGNRRVYKNWEQTEDSFNLPLLTEQNTTGIVYDGDKQQIIYIIPSQDQTFTVRGWMVVSLSPLGLAENLVSDRSINPGNRVQIISGRGMITDIRPEQFESVDSSIDQIWSALDTPDAFGLLSVGGDETFWLASSIASDGTWVGKIVPGRLLSFPLAVQILLIFSVYITVALIVFLILNFRQEKTEILRKRINKLQVEIFRDWLENHEGRKIHLVDIESRREEIRKELRRGLGNLSDENSDKIDSIIDDGWSRVSEILAKKEIVRDEVIQESSKVNTPPIEMKQLEDMITRALAGTKIVVSSDAVSQTPSLTPQMREPLALEVEEINETESEESIHELPDIEELEEIDEIESEESIHELPDIEELEEIDEFESEESIHELPDIEELEEIDEIEDSALESPDGETGSDLDELEVSEETKEITAAVQDADIEEIFDEIEDIEEFEDTEEEGAPQSDDIEQFVDIENLISDNDDNNIEGINPDDSDEVSHEVLEILPVVLTDDTRELIEIDKVNRDELFMNINNYDQESVESIAEAEELDELEELEELDENPEDKSVNREVEFIDMKELIKEIKRIEPVSITDDFHVDPKEITMESLIINKTTGILPEVDENSMFFLDESAKITWSDDGLDYDEFLSGFKKNTTGIYKSLMKISKQYNAICAVLLSGSDNGLESEYSVGLDGDSAACLSVDMDEQAWVEWFSNRQIVFVPNLKSSLYSGKIQRSDYRYIQSGLFIPALFQGSHSYIFLGFKEVLADPTLLLVNNQKVK